MKLYDTPYAPNPCTVRLFIAERGGPALKVEAVNLGALESRGLAHRAINPSGTVPALVSDDERVVSDILSICEYVDEIARGGATPEARVLTRIWPRRVDGEIAPPVVA